MQSIALTLGLYMLVMYWLTHEGTVNLWTVLSLSMGDKTEGISNVIEF